MTPARGVPSTAIPNNTVIASLSPAAYSFVPSNGSQYTATRSNAIGRRNSGANPSSSSASPVAAAYSKSTASSPKSTPSIELAFSKLSSATNRSSGAYLFNASTIIASTRRSASVCASPTYVPSVVAAPPLSRTPNSPPSVTSRMISFPRVAIARHRRKSVGTCTVAHSARSREDASAATR